MNRTRTCRPFYVGCRVLNPATYRSTTVRRLMVDTGAEYTWIDATVLQAIRIERCKKDLQFHLANGQIVSRSVGYAILNVAKASLPRRAIFNGSARALQGLNLHVDSRRKRLVPAGPIVSAAAVPRRCPRSLGVPSRKLDLVSLQIAP